MYIEGNIKLKDHLLNCIKDQWGYSEMKKYFIENAERFVEKGLYKFYVEFGVAPSVKSVSFKCDDKTIHLEYPLKVNDDKLSLDDVRNEFVNWLRKEHITVDDRGVLIMIDLLDEDFAPYY